MPFALVRRWRETREKIANFIGTDKEVVRKIEKMDQHNRKIGHDLRNLQTKLEPLRRMIENGDGD